MNLSTHFKKAKFRADLNSQINQRQDNAKRLLAYLQNLYAKIDNGKIHITKTQKIEINRLRVECQEKQREMSERYMQKEIDTIEDLAGKYQYVPPQIVDSKGNIIKEDATK